MWWDLPFIIWGGYHVICVALVLLLWLTRQVSHAGERDLSTWFSCWTFKENSVLLQLYGALFPGRTLVGQSIGLNVIVRTTHPQLMKQTVKHEECHCWQQLVLGPLMPLLYLLFMLVLKLRKKDPYFDNPFEVQARRYASRA